MTKLRVVLVAAALAAACGGTAPSEDETSSNLGQRRHAPACPGPVDGARCHAWVRMDASGAQPDATTGPTGLNPADLQAAYKLNSATAGAGQVIAIVDAFDDPNA